MIDERSVQAVNATRLNSLDPRFGKPLYDTYCFSQLPQTIYHLLTGDSPDGLPSSVFGELPQRYKKVILCFVDAFGWRFFERYSEQYPFLKRFLAEGVVSKLTTQFPSTTAVHTTTIHTGLPVGQSGVFEWFYYEPLLDRVIAPLLFSFAGDKERNTLQSTGIAPEALFPQQTFYRKLSAKGVKSYIFQHRDYTPSPFSDVVFAGARTVRYKTLSEAMINLTNAVENRKDRAYYFFYFDAIDSLGHVYGPGSRQFEAEIDTFMTVLEKFLYGRLSSLRKLKETLLLITADHGQIEVSPDNTLYLNQMTPSIEPFIKRNRNGDLIVPAGSSRDMCLYIQDDCLDEAHALLTEQLNGRAGVYRVQRLIDEGYFGSEPPSPTFLSRVGNLIILPYDSTSVWWYEQGRFQQRFWGNHGGLTPAEMETILLALPLGR